MKYKVINQFKNDYLNNILKSRGIEDIQAFIKPTEGNIQYCMGLDNIERGAMMLLNHISQNNKMIIIVDCDCDGYTSSAILWNFLNYYFPDYVLNNLSFLIHEGKQHGLEDMMDELKDNYYDIVIVPDAGSNDYEYQKQLNELGIDCLIIDHHSVDNIDSDYYLKNEHCIIINNQLSNNYKNKFLSGAGVTWQFCHFLENSSNFLVENKHYTLQLLDLAAVGIIGDCMNMKELENRTFSYYGLHTIYNPLLKAIISKQAFSLKREKDISPIGVGFYIVPLINSIIRVGTYEEKINLFKAFIDGNTIVASTKRGAKKNETETLAEQMARVGANCKSRQDTMVENAMSNIEMNMLSNGVNFDNTILIAELNDDLKFPSTLNGLIAMKLQGKYKKPTLVVRKNDEGYLKGSARNDGSGEFKNFRNFLLNSKLFEYAQGHENAFGVSIKEKNIDKFIQYANKELSHYNFNDNFYEVDFCCEADDKEISKIIFDVYKDDTLWGQQNEIPLLCITKIKLKQEEIKVIGSKLNTLKFRKNNIEYIKFFATKEIEELTNAGDNFILTVIGEGTINRWNGFVTPQIIIRDFEIGGTIYDF